MIKVQTILLFLLLGSGSLFAQEDQKYCYTTEKYRELLQTHPEVLRSREQLEQFTRQYIRHASAERRNNHTTYIIPVVFHIIHNYGQENISDAQVIDEVRVLNLDYRKLNPDTVDIVPAFKQIAADADMEFRLASIDPNGNCTNGIDRIVSTLTYNAGDNAKLNPWPNDQYLNIWIVNSLSMAGAAAYAYYPGTAGPGQDGVICLSGYVGSIGSGSPNRSHVITHEIGHCMNLEHPWGNNNDVGTACGDDLVSDTPETEGWTACVLNASVCNPPVIENVQNYMDYAYCDKMFTFGQVQRMHGALNSTASGRNNLWTAANLNNTGTFSLPAAVCSPVAAFYGVTPTVCAGSTVTFYDLSTNGHPSSWNWTFPGGTPAASTDSIVIVRYTNPGNYNVSLSVSNTAGSNTLTIPGYVQVAGAAANNAPYYESFEDPGSFPGSDGYIVNPDGGSTWVRVTNAASNGVASIRMNNYNNPQGAVDGWVSPSFDLSNVTQPVLTFKYAAAQRFSSSNDVLKLYGSSDCGRTWRVRWSASGTGLSTAGVVSSSYLPANTNDWRQETVSMAAFAQKPHVQFKFECTSGGGNNIYIDEINLNGIYLDVEGIGKEGNRFMLYPNPANETTTLGFTLSKTQSVSARMIDIAGRVVQSISAEELNAGMHEFKLSLPAPGIYFVELDVNGNHRVQKLVVE